MRRFLLSSLLLCGGAQAAPYLVADPYPATGAQPSEFVITISGIIAPIVSPAVNVTGGKGLRFDFGSVALGSGVKSLTVKARNAWGESPASAPFQFTAGSPAAPSGVGLVAE